MRTVVSAFRRTFIGRTSRPAKAGHYARPAKAGHYGWTTVVSAFRRTSLITIVAVHRRDLHRDSG